MLELCEAVMDDTERCALRGDGLSDAELKTHATNIKWKCKFKMWEYEGSDPILEEGLKKNKSH
jgi:hypothetical protein